MDCGVLAPHTHTHAGTHIEYTPWAIFIFVLFVDKDWQWTKRCSRFAHYTDRQCVRSIAIHTYRSPAEVSGNEEEEEKCTITFTFMWNSDDDDSYTKNRLYGTRDMSICASRLCREHDSIPNAVVTIACPCDSLSTQWESQYNFIHTRTPCGYVVTLWRLWKPYQHWQHICELCGYGFIWNENNNNNIADTIHTIHSFTHFSRWSARSWKIAEEFDRDELNFGWICVTRIDWMSKEWKERERQRHTHQI